MAFIFVPGPDGSFTEGDRQTNPDTGIEYIYDSGAWRAIGPRIEDEFDTLDERYLKKTGGTLTNSLKFNKGNKANQQFSIEPNSSSSDTNVYVYDDGQLRLRSTHTSSAGDRKGSHIVLDPKGGIPETKIYHVVTPTDDDMAANKEYVDSQIANLPDIVPSDNVMTKQGDQILKDGIFKIRQNKASGVLSTYVVIKDDELYLYHVASPTSPEHGVNRKYVDEKIDVLTSGSIPTNNALQSQIDDIKQEMIPISVLEDIFEAIDDEFKEIKAGQDLINYNIRNLEARIDALENP